MICAVKYAFGHWQCEYETDREEIGADEEGDKYQEKSCGEHGMMGGERWGLEHTQLQNGSCEEKKCRIETVDADAGILERVL